MLLSFLPYFLLAWYAAHFLKKEQRFNVAKLDSRKLKEECTTILTDYRDLKRGASPLVFLYITCQSATMVLFAFLSVKYAQPFFFLLMLAILVILMYLCVVLEDVHVAFMDITRKAR